MKSYMSRNECQVAASRAPAREANSFLVAFFIACLFPFSIGGFGSNYLFVLIPVGVLMTGGRLIRPKIEVIIFLCLCFIWLLLSTVYQMDWIDYIDRRFISFSLFICGFSLCFIKVTQCHIHSFKLAIVLAASIFSMQSLITFISLGDAAQAFESKDIVGSQRYGFVYIFAFWILWYDGKVLSSALVKQFLLALLLLGIALTFSRASVVAFAGSGMLAVARFLATSRVSFSGALKAVFYTLVFLTLGLQLIYMVAPIVIEFFAVRLIDYIASGASLQALGNPETSDGTRIYIWANILEFVFFNPITGSGFLGVWVLNLFDGFSGSAHSQYFDTLFRLGPFLFIVYLVFILKMLQTFRKVDAGFFVGLAGVLVYGIFHETFKESHGAFVFAMLIAISFQRSHLYGAYGAHILRTGN